MLESLSIKNFRNFRSLQIESLSRVNLVVGKNNAGKSNLLDAISIYAMRGDPKHLFDLLEAKKECRWLPAIKEIVYRESLQDSLASIFHGRILSFDGSRQIVIDDPNITNPLKIGFLFGIDKVLRSRGTTTPAMGILDRNDYDMIADDGINDQAKGLAMFSIECGKTDWLIGINGPDYIVRFPPDSFVKPSLQYIRTQFILNHDNAEFWDEVDLTNKEYLALDALQILLPDITRLSYKSDKKGLRIPYVKLRSQEMPVPLHSMGEGVDRILTLILHLVNAENGTLLIDEFENGLHYTIQEPLWRMIFQVAEKLNVQVFATTHSEDCLRAFNEVLKEDTYAESGQVISLAKVKDDIECSIYKARHLEEAMENEMEVR